MSRAEPARLLDWDTAFWGVTVGRVEGDVLTEAVSADIDRWAAEHSVDCLYFLARADEARTVAVAVNAGYRLVDVRVQLDRDVAPDRPAEGVRRHRAQDVPELRSIARASHDRTRFFADPQFPRERSLDLYETWIEESCNGWADAVLVAEQEGAVAGYVTCHLADVGVSASIGLLGVAPGARAAGLGGRLVSGAVDWCAGRDVARLSVVTQGGNVAAQRLYQRHAFRTSSVGLWFHKWYAR